MPKITREKIKQAKYTSMADLYRQLDMIPNFDDKVEFATNYLLSHGADGKATDYSFEEAVHLARLKLVDESKKLRDKIYNDEEGPEPAAENEHRQNLVLDLSDDDDSLVDDSVEEESEMEKGLVSDDEEPSIEA